MTVYKLEILDWPNDQFLGIFSTLELAKSQVATGDIPWKQEGGTYRVDIPGEEGTYTITPVRVDER